MHRAGIAERLIRVADAALGRMRGGLGQVDVGASMLFGAVSGSAIASVSGIGSSLVPMMREKGYDADYAVNVSVTSAITGLLIPPSHNMIIYAAAAGVSISLADLFLAGIMPGLLTGGLLMVVAWIVAVKRNYPRGEFPGWRAFGAALAGAIPGLIAAAIIVVGVLSGVFTPTESSGIAVIYTLIQGSPSLDPIMEDMDKVETQLVNKQLSNEMLKRQQEILTRLLEAERAEREREMDNERRAEMARQTEKTLPPALEEYMKKREAEIESYRTASPVLRPYYKFLVEEYYNALKNQ
jgi:TRAP-type uncharacterized transport system fused permease subunit